MRPRKSAAFVLLFVLAAPPVLSAEPLTGPSELLKKADEALDRADRKKADFYVARYLGVCATAETGACRDEALEPILKKRELEPKAFVPADWDPAFLDWFEKSIRARWGVEPERVRERGRSFEIAQSLYRDKYFVTVVAYPVLELWHAVKDGVISRPMALPMGSFHDRPTLFFGKMMKGASFQSHPLFLDTQKRTLHAVWKPEFFDLDRNGEPEVWVRFNLAWGNGFAQMLDVYTIEEEKELKLLHRFQGTNDGFARRLEDGSVEVSSSVRTAPNTQRVETWRFENGKFKKTAEKQVPSILRSSEWRSIYLE